MTGLLGDRESRTFGLLSVEEFVGVSFELAESNPDLVVLVAREDLGVVGDVL